MLHSYARTKLLGVSLCLAVSLVACKSSETVSDEETFELPPRLSMVVGSETFPSDASTKAVADALQHYDFSQSTNDQISQTFKASLAAVGDKSYFNEAFLKVAGWSFITTAGTALPRLAFYEAFKHKPEKQSDGSWQWTYQFGGLLIGRHTARLVGYVEADQVYWEMYLSKNDSTFTDFNWFNGQHDIGRNAGSWTLRKAPDSDYDFVRIDWERDRTAGTAMVKYTNIIPATSGDPKAAENGGYIGYGTTADVTYDAYFDIYNKGADNLVEIEWNIASENGRIKNPATYGDVWNYWDSDHYNTTAPMP